MAASRAGDERLVARRATSPIKAAQINPDNTWHIVEIGDLNLDARSDFLWQNGRKRQAQAAVTEQPRQRRSRASSRRETRAWL